MSDFNNIDIIHLADALYKLGQDNSDPARVKAMAIKLLQNMASASDVSAQDGAELKSSDLSSLDTMIKFLKSHNVLSNGYPIVSDTKRNDDDRYWGGDYINQPAFKVYLDHLHTAIKDPINKPKLDAIVSQANIGLETNYKHQANKDQPVDPKNPGTQSAKPGETPPQAAGQTGQTGQTGTAEDSELLRPYDGQSIDLGNIFDWLTDLNNKSSSTKYKGIARYSGIINDGLRKVHILIGMSSTGDAPLFLGQPLNTIYNNVKQRGLERSNNDPRVALSFTYNYLEMLLEFVGTTQQVLSAVALMFPNKQDEVRQQHQWAQSAEIQVRQWQAQLPGVQETIEGRH
jgi:hypothetical protein